MWPVITCIWFFLWRFYTRRGPLAGFTILWTHWGTCSWRSTGRPTFWRCGSVQRRIPCSQVWCRLTYSGIRIRCGVKRWFSFIDDWSLAAFTPSLLCNLFLRSSCTWRWLQAARAPFYVTLGLFDSFNPSGINISVLIWKDSRMTWSWQCTVHFRILVFLFACRGWGFLSDLRDAIYHFSFINDCCWTVGTLLTVIILFHCSIC